MSAFTNKYVYDVGTDEEPSLNPNPNPTFKNLSNMESVEDDCD